MELILITNFLALVAIVISIFLVMSSRKAERARKIAHIIERERNRLDAILSSMGEAMIVVDIKTNVLMMNQSAAVRLRLAPQEAVGRSIEDILHVKIKGKSIDIRTELDTMMRTINQKRVGVSDDYTVTNTSGISFPVALTLTPLLQSGNIAGSIILFHDITKEKEIDKAKNEFVSFVSHQLRTPLGSMRWNMEMLIAGDFGYLSEDTVDVLEDMHKANQFLIGLVNELLDISKIQAGNIQDKPHAVNALEIINTVVAMLQGEAKQREVTISIKAVKTNLSPIWVDPDRFRDVIQNLIANAIKYNKAEGSVIITLSNEDDKLLISIADTGIGIPEEDQQNIFSKFFRASNAAHGSVQGTGLGLFMVKSFVDRNDGKIWFMSKSDQGTTFNILLPFFIERWQQ